MSHSVHGRARASTLKVASHGSKLKNFPKGEMPEQVIRIITHFSLLEFAECPLTMLDTFLLSPFVEWWHPERSSFHLPFGEMTITLDDVSSLFHIPIVGIFFTSLHINQGTPLAQVVEDLEVDEDEVLEEFSCNRGLHLWMYWLRERYDELVAAERYEVAARAYMLHLMVCILSADKSGVYIDDCYLWMFSSLDTPN
ncbi:protein MAIN-LIKE 1-like [Vicia villosa]|uniref:protein MAIN-LIKE 1-like n=1 Tax=Vicia villosa TaxID=3911 RepID=UPI00273BADF5|nr:protein MAIN-LIKE 1-like [Vicia villosa]